MALKRAADLSRNTDGLFNINQVEFIDALIDAYAATGRFAEAEKESLYAMRVEEAAYGRSSIKLLDRLDKLARWYEAERRYTSERNVYERALHPRQERAGKRPAARRAAARHRALFRLEAFYGVEGADTGATFNSGTAGAPVFADGTQQRRGESSLTTALAVIDANSPVNQQLRGEVLTDLGDWFLVDQRAAPRLRHLCRRLEGVRRGEQHQAISRRRACSPTGRRSARSIDRSSIRRKPCSSRWSCISRWIATAGIEDVTSPTTDVPETIVRNSVASMKRSRYAPRIENGAAVATRRRGVHRKGAGQSDVAG